MSRVQSFIYRCALGLALLAYVATGFHAVQVAQAAVSSTSNFKRSDGTGALTAFTFTFRVLTNSDLQVYLVSAANVATRETEGVNYTLALANGGLGGTVTFMVAPALTEDVILVNVPELTQPATFSPGGAFSEADLETALDRAVLNDTAQEEELARAIKLKIADPLNTTGYGGLYIATEANRGGKILQWNDAGTEIETGASSDDLEDVADGAAAAQASAAAAAGSAGSAASAAAAASASATAAGISAASASSSSSSASSSAASVIAAWRGAWVTSTAYAVGEKVSNGGSSYISILAHTSGATSEPGVGGTYTTYWNVLAAKGAAGAGTGDMLAANNLNDVANKSTSRANLGVAIGTNVQAYDADLAALAGLTSAADKGVQFTGSGTAGTYDLTTAGKALLDDASAAAQRTTLGLGTAAVLDTGTAAGKVVVLDGSAKLPAVDGSQLTNLTVSGLTCATPIATTSGTSATFTSLPAGVARIDMGFSLVSGTTTGALALQIGDSGGLETSYTGGYQSLTNPTASYAVTGGTTSKMNIGADAVSSDSFTGTVSFILVNPANNTWSVSGVLYGENKFVTLAYTHALSAQLDRVSLQLAAGTLDSGVINICYQ